MSSPSHDYGQTTRPPGVITSLPWWTNNDVVVVARTNDQPTRRRPALATCLFKLFAPLNVQLSPLPGRSNGETYQDHPFLHLRISPILTAVATGVSACECFRYLLHSERFRTLSRPHRFPPKQPLNFPLKERRAEVVRVRRTVIPTHLCLSSPSVTNLRQLALF